MMIVTVSMTVTRVAIIIMIIPMLKLWIKILKLMSENNRVYALTSLTVYSNVSSRTVTNISVNLVNTCPSV